jgi:hypothetical protein
MFIVHWDDEENAVKPYIKAEMKNKDIVQFNTEFIKYVYFMEAKLLEAEVIEFLEIKSEHIRSGQMFRAHPNYRGKGVWRDWVMIHWAEGNFPAQIWG